MPFVVNIVDVSRVTRNGRMFTTAPPKSVEVFSDKHIQVDKPTVKDKLKFVEGQSSGTSPNDDEILKSIKRSEYKIIDKLLQTPSKIYVLSLLLNSEAHMESLMKVLYQAFVHHDVTINQFDHIVG